MRVAFFVRTQDAKGEGTPAKSTSARHERDRGGAKHLFTLALDDVPELRASHPGADAIGIFAKEAKAPHDISTIIEPTSLDAPDSFGMRVLTFDLPVDYYGEKLVHDQQPLRDARPYWIAAAVLTPNPERPLLVLQDADVGLELEEDEGHFLVFANGASRYQHA
jgi:hypothetical protein